MIKKAVIPAAGWGTRFLPATKAIPKEMLPLVDKPAIQYIVEEAVTAGIEDILIITSRNKKAIEDHFDRFPDLENFLKSKKKENLLGLIKMIAQMAEIHYIRQKEQLGLGHAVLCARKFVGQDPFAVLLGDDIVINEPNCLQQLMAVFKETQGVVIAVQEVTREEVNRYGIIDPASENDRLFLVKDMVEKPLPERAPSNLAIIGRYILLPEIFPVLAKIPPGAGGEIQLTDALKVLARQGKVYAYKFQGRRYDVGDKLGFLQATVEFALTHPELAAPFKAYLTTLLSSKTGFQEVATGREI
ncbi:MAG TPA: UTP--glucose-1-phosphate uridylyltransferase GalU [Moorella mulderi]|nr:UTP--glucose-1-phosphate uridylyltransferase GalU [Moorella mulderi]